MQHCAVHLRLTFPDHQEEQQFAVFYHAQVWLLPILTGPFVCLMWLCALLSIIAGILTTPGAPLLYVSAIIAFTAACVAVLTTTKIWHNPMLAANEAMVGCLYCSSLAAALSVFLLYWSWCDHTVCCEHLRMPWMAAGVLRQSPDIMSAVAMYQHVCSSWLAEGIPHHFCYWACSGPAPDHTGYCCPYCFQATV